ncbi:MAG: hypothetical protein DWB42_11250 [Chloroflexi bacterium]|nr:hypothetical protein [Chloroflexota bacterium]MDL1884891.1 hypothetical protein [Anaerolineae bacterium CFX8]GIL11356.1 MAG: hypothetical protein BroJett038_00760 [Chloroflexota bacterium]
MAVDVQQSIYTELADFLVSRPTLEEIAAYQVSPGVQQYLDDLLEKNREGVLSADERLELEKILAVSHMMTLTKTKAQLKLAGKA